MRVPPPRSHVLVMASGSNSSGLAEDGGPSAAEMASRDPPTRNNPVPNRSSATPSSTGPVTTSSVVETASVVGEGGDVVKAGVAVDDVEADSGMLVVGSSLLGLPTSAGDESDPRSDTPRTTPPTRATTTAAPTASRVQARFGGLPGELAIGAPATGPAGSTAAPQSRQKRSPSPSRWPSAHALAVIPPCPESMSSALAALPERDRSRVDPTFRSAAPRLRLDARRRTGT